MNIDRYIGKETEFSFEHRIFNTVLVFGIVIAVVAIGFNYLLGLGTLITGTSIISGIVLGILYYLSLIKKIYKSSVVFFIFMLVFVLAPVAWFSNGGMSGGTAFYIIIFSSAIAVLFRGYARIMAFGCLVIMTFALILIEYRAPSLILGYDSTFKKYVDISFGLLIALITITLLFIVITNHYINEHKRANRYLMEIEKQKIDSLNEQFVRVFNASPALMAIYREKDLIYVAANDNWLECLGYQRSEVIGHSAVELNTLGLAESLSRLALEPEECQIQTKHGEIRELLVSKARLQLNGEECILLASIDRTMSKHLEKEIARLDRLNLVGEMAASIGHEIRNPLTTVRGFLQLFQTRKQYAQDIQNIDLMIAELDRANSIISEYLSLAKNRMISLKINSLNKIITELYPLIYATAVSEGVEVILEMDDVPDVLADENEIRQLLLNLTKNAIEAMPGGGKITINTRSINDNVILVVKDTGIGIPPEICEKLGTPFFTTKEKGTGLGLAVCYRIVEKHNADLQIDTGSSGTTFSIRFKAV